jgi:hypothetical protein
VNAKDVPDSAMRKQSHTDLHCHPFQHAQEQVRTIGKLVRVVVAYAADVESRRSLVISDGNGICRIQRRVPTQRLTTLGGRARAGEETSLSSPLTSRCERERRMCTATIGVVNDPPSLLPTIVGICTSLPSSQLPLPRPHRSSLGTSHH